MRPLLRFWLITLGLLSSAPALTLDEVVADRKIWPHRVTTSVALEMPGGADGKKGSARSIPAGTPFSVKEIKLNGVVVDLDGTEVLIPAELTDLLTRAATIVGQLRSLSESPSSGESVVAPPAAAARAGIPVAPRPAVVAPIDNRIARELEGDLVSLQGNRLAKFDPAALGSKKYLLVYFSAHWCPPCRALTPELVKWYNNFPASVRDKFDIVFYSQDRSAEDMLTYMIETNMPWPALAYSETGRRNVLAKYAGPAIPDLVLLDAQGNVLSDSFQGTTYLGPSRVANDLVRLLRNP